MKNIKKIYIGKSGSGKSYECMNIANNHYKGITIVFNGLNICEKEKNELRKDTLLIFDDDIISDFNIMLGFTKTPDVDFKEIRLLSSIGLHFSKSNIIFTLLEENSSVLDEIRKQNIMNVFGINYTFVLKE